MDACETGAWRPAYRLSEARRHVRAELAVRDSSDTSSDHVVRTNERNSAPRRLSSTYTRALWIVVVLNLGYGIIETLVGCPINNMI